MFRRHWLRGSCLVSALACSLLACGGDDDDAADAAPPDSGASASAQNLGRACNSDNLCPNQGEICLLGSSGDGFCSILCSGPGDTSCGTDYAGPGAPVCIFNLLDDAGNQTGQSACGVVCDAPDTTCPPSICDGTSCPGGLQCVAANAELSVCDVGDGGGGSDAGVTELRVDPPTGRGWPVLYTRRLYPGSPRSVSPTEK
jgi:hypothetical protein